MSPQKHKQTLWKQRGKGACHVTHNLPQKPPKDKLQQFIKSTIMLLLWLNGWYYTVHTPPPHSPKRRTLVKYGFIITLCVWVHFRRRHIKTSTESCHFSWMQFWEESNTFLSVCYAGNKVVNNTCLAGTPYTFDSDAILSGRLYFWTPGLWLVLRQCQEKSLIELNKTNC